MSVSRYPVLKVSHPLKISVISPSYNHASFLPQNLDSLLNQTYPHFEVIVVNDASTDSTHEVLSTYAAKNSRLIYHRLERNQGTMGAFNAGYQLATGDLIYGSASDDYLATPFFFERVINLISQNPQAAGVFGLADMVSAETGKSIGFLGNMGGQSGYVPPEDCMNFFLAHNALIPGVSCVWRKDLVDQIGGYPVELGPQSDYFVNHALAGLAGVVFLPKKVAVHRMSTSSYNARVTFQQRIRNYALVEKKMRELKLHEGIEPSVFISWRERLIENLMVAAPQRQMFQFFREIIGSLNSEFWSYAPESSKTFFSSIPSECDRLEKELSELKNWALNEFKKETGVH